MARRAWMVLLAVTSAVCALVACVSWSKPGIVTGDRDGWSKKQAEALERLAQQSTESLYVERWDKAGTVARLELALPARGEKKSVTEVATNFVENNATLWNLTSLASVAVTTQAVSPRCTAVLFQRLGPSSARVINAELAVSVANDGTIYRVVGRLTGEALPIPTDPQRSAPPAPDKARAALLSKFGNPSIGIPTPTHAWLDPFFLGEGAHNLQAAVLFADPGPSSSSRPSFLVTSDGTVAGAFPGPPAELDSHGCGRDFPGLRLPAVVMDPMTQTPAFVGLRAFGGIPTRAPNPTARAIEVLESEPLRRLYGSLAPASHLSPMDVRNTPRGEVLVRLRQVHDGVPVEGAHLNVVLDPAGRGVEVSGRFVYRPRAARVPALSEEVALQQALPVAVGMACGDDAACRQAASKKSPAAKLVVLSSEIFHGTRLPPKAARLAWKIDHAGRRLFWDAERKDGLLLSFPTVWDFMYTVRNRGAGNVLEVRDGVIQSGVTPDPETVTLMRIVDPDLTNPIEAFYRARDWNSFDNAGSSLTLLIRAGTRYASWVPKEGGFEGADPLSLKFSPGWVLPDVTAHEFTHGVIEFSAGFSEIGETGALGESYGDVIASVIFPDCSDGSQSPSCTPGTTWLVGEGSPIGFLRDLMRPETNCTNAEYSPCDAHARHYAQIPHNCGSTDDKNNPCEGHRLSAIPSFAATFMADGGVPGSNHPGIGRPKLGELSVRTLLGGRLFSAAQFTHHTIATVSTCYDLAARGQAGFTIADCDHVERSLLQVGLATNIAYGVYRFSDSAGGFRDNTPYFTGQRLYRGCTVATSKLVATDVDGSTKSVTGSKLEDLVIDMNGWGTSLASRAALSNPVDRSVVLRVWSAWHETGQVEVDDEFNMPAGVSTRGECLLPPPSTPAPKNHPRVLYSTKLVSEWADFFDGADGERPINHKMVTPHGYPQIGSIQMPPGCAVLSVQGLEYHGNQFLPPAMPQLNHFEHGYVVRGMAQTPRDLLAFVRWWHTGISSIKVRVQYTIAEDDGVDCMVPGATQDAP